MKKLINALNLGIVLGCMSFMGHATVKTSPMETLKVTYRSPTDYALYQQTTQMLVQFNLELQNDIHWQIHDGIRGMANTFGVNTNQSDNLAVNSLATTNSLYTVRASYSAE